MTATALLQLLRTLEDAGVAVWLDGGWGVDALLEAQTRSHKDVDILVCVPDVPRLREALARIGFVIRDGAPPHAFVLADGSGLEVDVHAVVLDEAGNGVHRMENGSDWVFPAEGLTGRGRVAGTSVRCLSPSAQVLCHAQGYVPDENDLRDMQLLHDRFGVELPAPLKRSARCSRSGAARPDRGE
jgi:lincosamide nucleotidyltransferase A/C/D/E